MPRIWIDKLIQRHNQVCPFVMWYGRNRYVQTPPTGSVIPISFRLVKFAGKGRWLNLKKLTADGFWDRAKPSTYSESARPSWMTYDDAFVDEVKRGLRACKGE